MLHFFLLICRRSDALKVKTNDWERRDLLYPASCLDLSHAGLETVTRTSRLTRFIPGENQLNEANPQCCEKRRFQRL